MDDLVGDYLSEVYVLDIVQSVTGFRMVQWLSLSEQLIRVKMQLLSLQFPMLLDHLSRYLLHSLTGAVGVLNRSR